MRNPDYQSNLSTILTIAVLIAIFLGLTFGAADQQAIRETELDKRLINSRIVFVQQGGNHE